MNTRNLKLMAIVITTALASAATGYWFAHERSTTKPTASTANDRQALYWYDPMSPTQHFDKPGKSPFMDMQLVPKYADDDAGALRIDPTIVQNLGVRLATVEHGALSSSLDAVGSIAYDARNAVVIQARSNGFVARVYARAAGDVVRAGAPLVDLLVPEWTAAQREFLALTNSHDATLASAARERLTLLGMPDDLIARVEKDREPRAAYTVNAPIGGALEVIEVREGMTIATGMTLARVNKLDPVWLEAAIPETHAAGVTQNSTAEVRLAAFPGEAFHGRVVAVLPDTNAETRTLRLRIEIANPELKLRPGMFAQVRLAAT